MIDRAGLSALAVGAALSVGGAGEASLRGASAEAQSADFGAVLAQVATSAVEALRAGEATAIAGVRGQASVQQVVEAVMSAEQTLQSAVAIRDKVVAAYLELSRMAI